MEEPLGFLCHLFISKRNFNGNIYIYCLKKLKKGIYLLNENKK